MDAHSAGVFTGNPYRSASSWRVIQWSPVLLSMTTPFVKARESPMRWRVLIRSERKPAADSRLPLRRDPMADFSNTSRFNHFRLAMLKYVDMYRCSDRVASAGQRHNWPVQRDDFFVAAAVNRCPGLTHAVPSPQPVSKFGVFATRLGREVARVAPVMPILRTVLTCRPGVLSAAQRRPGRPLRRGRAPHRSPVPHRQRSLISSLERGAPRVRFRTNAVRRRATHWRPHRHPTRRPGRPRAALPNAPAAPHAPAHESSANRLRAAPAPCAACCRTAYQPPRATQRPRTTHLDAHRVVAFMQGEHVRTHSRSGGQRQRIPVGPHAPSHASTRNEESWQSRSLGPGLLGFAI